MKTLANQHKLVRYYRPERYRCGGCDHIGIEVGRNDQTVLVRDLARPRTFYQVPVEDVQYVPDEPRGRVTIVCHRSDNLSPEMVSALFKLGEAAFYLDSLAIALNTIAEEALTS